MPRIRTVKPELFKHVELYDLEVETGLPIRFSFAGLFTCCDRAGRFKWCARTLKTDVLPHDFIDFSLVLDALRTRGFIKRYTANGKDYGCIPTWEDHQSINNRESQSVIPDISQGIEFIEEILLIGTRGSRVDDATQGERKGKERKGKERKEYTSPKGEEYKSSKNNILKGTLLDNFIKFWEVFNYAKGKADAAEAFYKLNPDEELLEKVLYGAKMAASNRSELINKGQTPKMPQGWITARRWEDELKDNNIINDIWTNRLVGFIKKGTWFDGWGQEPTTDGKPAGPLNVECGAYIDDPDLVNKLFKQGTLI